VQSGHSLPLIARVLNQSNQQVTAVYARFGDAGLKEALEGHGAAISEFMSAPPLAPLVEPLLPAQSGEPAEKPKNTDARVQPAEQVLVEAKFIMAMREKACTKKDLYRKLGSQFVVNRFEMQRILDEMIERRLISRLWELHSWRYALFV
jgi:hypothetical protein